MAILILSIILLQFGLCIIKPIYGVGMFFAARILIPECARVNDSVSLNTALIFVLFLFMFKDILLKKNSLKWRDFSLTKYYLIFAIFAFVCLIFSSYSNFSFQLHSLIQFFVTNMLPGIMSAYYLQNKGDVKITIKILTISTIICCVWGIFTFLLNSNPYVDFFNSSFMKVDKISSSTSLDEVTRGLGRFTSATFVHTNGFGYFLPITFAFYFFLNKIRPNSKYAFLLVLLPICIISCLKRSALISFVAFFVAYTVFLPNMHNRIKIISSFVVVAILLFIVVELIPSLEKAKGIIECSLFFWNDELAVKYGIGGSSFAMRIIQWVYPFIEVRDNLIFGKGFGWTTLYLTQNPFHPFLYGFETIIAEAVVTMGIMGIFIWFWIFWKSYKYSSKNDEEKLYYKLFTITQLTIAIATGFSYFVFFGLYIALLNKIYLLKGNN